MGEERREKPEGGVSYISICTVQSRSGKERGRGEKKSGGRRADREDGRGAMFSTSCGCRE